MIVGVYFNLLYSYCQRQTHWQCEWGNGPALGPTMRECVISSKDIKKAPRGDGARPPRKCSPAGAKARAQFAMHKGDLAEGEAPFVVCKLLPATIVFQTQLDAYY